MAYDGRDIDPEAGWRAIAFVAPLLERAATDPAIGQSGVAFAVIMNPARAHGTHRFEDSILIEQGFGKPREAWDADYAEYARKKARASWQFGVASGSPHAAAYWKEQGHGEPLAGGMMLEGVAVGVSGANPVYDEVLAGAIALSLRAVLRSWQ